MFSEARELTFYLEIEWMNQAMAWPWTSPSVNPWFNEFGKWLSGRYKQVPSLYSQRILLYECMQLKIHNRDVWRIYLNNEGISKRQDNSPDLRFTAISFNICSCLQNFLSLLVGFSIIRHHVFQTDITWSLTTSSICWNKKVRINGSKSSR
jgi:hypothetical protein